MMRRYRNATRLLLALMAGLAATGAAAQSEQTSAVYRCEDGSWFNVVFSGEIATLSDDRGRTYSLKQSPMASGFLYERAGNSLAGKGRGAAWTVKGSEPVSCSVTRNPQEALPGYRPVQTDLVHEATGIRFPLKVGDASRLGGTPADVTDNVALVRYNVPLADGGHAQVAIGIVHLEGLTAFQHYIVFRAEKLRTMQGGKVRDEGEFPIKGAIDGERGSFVGRDRAGSLITANFGYWSARIDSDYPLGEADEARKAIEAFVNEIDWSALRNAPSD